MSLVRIALRIAATKALMDKTFVGDRVYNSRIDAIRSDAKGGLEMAEKKPFVTIYTDSGTNEPEDGADHFSNGMVELNFEMGIAEQLQIMNEDTGETFAVVGEYQFIATDGVMDDQLDLLASQVWRALNDADDVWANIYRSLLMSVSSVRRSRIATGQGDSRKAAHQISVLAEAVEDPISGEELPDDAPFARFLIELAKGDADEVLKATLLGEEIAGTAPDWKNVQTRLGLTQSDLMAIGLGPIRDDEDRATPDHSDGSLEISRIAPEDMS
ncbi:hypothetical protein [Roseibium sp.]|uniref:hypothetical protein n=1 Tax=Roseibium sp. TaxID=1936156 RepID=UPI003B51A799